MVNLKTEKSHVSISIQKNILGLSDEGRKKINQVTSVFADNCFNCLNGENLPGADYGSLTQCEGIGSKYIGLKNSAGTEPCDIYDSEFPNK